MLVYLLIININFVIINIIDFHIKELRESLRQHINELGLAVGKSGKSFTLIIDGQSLKHALSHDLKMDFLELCLSCKSVICCRVSPMQKAEVRNRNLYFPLYVYLILIYCRL